jgi:hypothetical protein
MSQNWAFLPDAAAVAIMEQGGAVGRLARQLFAGGVEVSSRDPEQAIRTTRELIANPEVPAIFEAAFEDGGVFVRVDILHRRRDNGRWRLIEVKSTADLKEQHLDDVAIQHRVVSRSDWTWLPRASPTSIETMCFKAAPSTCVGSSRSRT